MSIWPKEPHLRILVMIHYKTANYFCNECSAGKRERDQNNNKKKTKRIHCLADDRNKHICRGLPRNHWGLPRVTATGSVISVTSINRNLSRIHAEGRYLHPLQGPHTRKPDPCLSFHCYSDELWKCWYRQAYVRCHGFVLICSKIGLQLDLQSGRSQVKKR